MSQSYSRYGHRTCITPIHNIAHKPVLLSLVGIYRSRVPFALSGSPLEEVMVLDNVSEGCMLSRMIYITLGLQNISGQSDGPSRDFRGASCRFDSSCR